LRCLVEEGLVRRYGQAPSTAVRAQVEHEFAMLIKLDLAGYFLIVWDIVAAAERLGVLAQGRGSAANSVICYALGITAIDPVGMGLLFERFLSEERTEYPDIDIDFSHEDREQILQYVYDRYGRHHAAMAAEVISYKTRSAVRDVAKAFGLSPANADRISAEYDATGSLYAALGLNETTNAPPYEALRDFTAAKEPAPRPSQATIPLELSRRIAVYTEQLIGFPRHLSIHVGGMVITPRLNVPPCRDVPCCNGIKTICKSSV
jgi:error-prone DNA polymerase